MCHVNNKTRLFLKTTLHISILLHHSLFPLYAVYAVQFMEDEIRATIMKYTWAYLTYWSFGFQITFLLLAVGCDMAEWNDYVDAVLYKKMKYWRDITFTGLVVPFTTFVTAMFWSVYSIDRELVYPRAYDSAVPWWFNHSVHTVTFFMVVLETLLQPRRRPVDHKTETIFYAGFSVFYAVLYYCIYFVTGVWLYRVFAVMTWWQICIYQAMIWLSFYVFYEIQFPVNRFVHGPADGHEDTVNSINKVTVEGQQGVHSSNGGEKEEKLISSTAGAQNDNSRNITRFFKNETQTIKA